jgi:ABC-2 type transport system permease protein
MKKYLTIFRIRFIHGVQYRIVVFSLIFTGFLWGLMLVLAYSAFYRSDPTAFPMTLSQTISYMWMQQVFLMLFSVTFVDGEIETSIESGSIAYELVRPADLYGRWFFRAGAGRTAYTVFRLPLLIAAFFLPAPYNLSFSPDLFQFIMFLLSTILALGVTVAFAMLMYVSMFHTTSYRGIRVFLIAATAFFTGAVIPFPFFPTAVRIVLEALPFAAMQNMPLRIYSGNIAGVNALKGILFQIIWFVLLVIIGKYLMNCSLKKVIVQGG